MLNKTDIEEIFRRWHEADPEPVTELDAPNEFCLLVSIVLSAQSTDAGVNKATPALFAEADTPEKMAALGLERIRHHIKTIGLFNSKAKNILALSEKIINEHDGKVPETSEELEALPGVGRKTANVWLNCARGELTMAVDTHVFRVANRIGLARTKTPAATEKPLLKKIPTHWMLYAHHWLILHGRYTCKARKPLCNNCRIVDLCQYKDKTEPA